MKVYGKVYGKLSITIITINLHVSSIDRANCKLPAKAAKEDYQTANYLLPATQRVDLEAQYPQISGVPHFFRPKLQINPA